MYRRVVNVAAAALVALSLGVTPAFAQGRAPEQAQAPERYIVVLNDAVADPEAVGNELSKKNNGRMGHVYEAALKGFSVELPPRAIAALSRDSRVAYVEADQKVTAFGETPTGVDRMEIDKKFPVETLNGKTVDVDVAVIDTGIASHPDLNIQPGGVNCASGSFFTGRCKTGGFADGNGHGTHVAGTIGARDNGIGVVGVAPGARLWAVRVLGNDGSGYTSWIIAGIDWVTKNADKIEVANMSLGCECYSKAQDDAIQRSINAGVVYVVAAGNSAKDASTFSPASHPNVIAVSALSDFDGKAGGQGLATCRADQDDTLADFSNYGPTVDIAARGVCINSTWLNGSYHVISGTSMASPHAAGAAALNIAENGTARNASRSSTVLAALQGDSWSVAQTDANGCGFVNERAALGSSERLLVVAPCDVVAPPPAPVETPVVVEPTA